MEDMQVLLHHVDGYDTEIMFSELLNANEFDPEEVEDMLAHLKAGKPYWSGGGAAPEWGIEPIKGQQMESDELSELRRRAGITENAQGLGPGGQMIYQSVMHAVQDAEEMGGVSSSMEYEALMMAIIDELESRIRALKSHDPQLRNEF